jgi:hypothetical protein
MLGTTTLSETAAVTRMFNPSPSRYEIIDSIRVKDLVGPGKPKCPILCITYSTITLNLTGNFLDFDNIKFG